MLFNSSYHWLLIEEDYIFNRQTPLDDNNNNNKDNNKNDNSMVQEINTNNNNNNENSKNNKKNDKSQHQMENVIKHASNVYKSCAEQIEKTLGNTTTIISSRLPRKLNSTSIHTATTIQAKKLTTKTYQQQQQQQQSLKGKEERVKLLHLSEAATTAMIQTATAIQTPITTRTIAWQRIDETIDNNLSGRRIRNVRCNDGSSCSCCSHILLAMNFQTTIGAATTRTKCSRRTSIDDDDDDDNDDGHNIEIIEKFLEQLEININTEIILAKRKWCQQEEQEDDLTTMMTAASHCVNKDSDSDVVDVIDVNVNVNVNVDDVIATTKGCLKRGNKHLNNDTFVYTKYDAHTSSSSPSSPSSTSSLLYMPTDDYLLHDIW